MLRASSSSSGNVVALDVVAAALRRVPRRGPGLRFAVGAAAPARCVHAAAGIPSFSSSAARAAGAGVFAPVRHAPTVERAAPISLAIAGLDASSATSSRCPSERNVRRSLTGDVSRSFEAAASPEHSPDSRRP